MSDDRVCLICGVKFEKTYIDAEGVIHTRDSPLRTRKGLRQGCECRDYFKVYYGDPKTEEE